MRTNQIAIIPIAIASLGAALSWKKERYRVILLVAAFGCVSNVAALANTGGNANYLVLPWLLTILLPDRGMFPALVPGSCWSDPAGCARADPPEESSSAKACGGS
jgi:hypothetical protein